MDSLSRRNYIEYGRSYESLGISEYESIGWRWHKCGIFEIFEEADFEK